MKYLALVLIWASAVSLTACQSSDSGTSAAEAGHATVLVQILDHEGSPVAGADVTLQLLAPFDLDEVIGTFSGTTDGSGEYSFRHTGPGEQSYPADVAVDPPSGAGLAARTVRDSVQFYWDYPPDTTVVEVRLEEE